MSRYFIVVNCPPFKISLTTRCKLASKSSDAHMMNESSARSIPSFLELLIFSYLYLYLNFQLWHMNESSARSVFSSLESFFVCICIFICNFDTWWKSPVLSLSSPLLIFLNNIGSVTLNVSCQTVFLGSFSNCVVLCIFEYDWYIPQFTDSLYFRLIKNQSSFLTPAPSFVGQQQWKYF